MRSRIAWPKAPAPVSGFSRAFWHRFGGRRGHFSSAASHLGAFPVTHPCDSIPFGPGSARESAGAHGAPGALSAIKQELFQLAGQHVEAELRASRPPVAFSLHGIQSAGEVRLRGKPLEPCYDSLPWALQSIQWPDCVEEERHGAGSEVHPSLVEAHRCETPGKHRKTGEKRWKT